MQIWCYTPKLKFVRFYLLVPDNQLPQSVSQDDLWLHIKRKVKYIEEDMEEYYWETPKEEAEERASWFQDWNQPRCWDACGSMASDTHY